MPAADTMRDDSAPPETALDQAINALLDGDFAAVTDYLAKAVLRTWGMPSSG